jgi:hypothetical protein
MLSRYRLRASTTAMTAAGAISTGMALASSIPPDMASLGIRIDSSDQEPQYSTREKNQSCPGEQHTIQSALDKSRLYILACPRLALVSSRMVT